jgi:LPXTG-motif cell wall-anchored protein
VYAAQWFDPRNGTWLNVGDGRVVANNIGFIQLPKLPSDTDWGLKLVYQGPRDPDVKYQEYQLETQTESPLRRAVGRFWPYAAAGGFLLLLAGFLLLRRRRQGASIS